MNLLIVFHIVLQDRDYGAGGLGGRGVEGLRGCGDGRMMRTHMVRGRSTMRT
jgi:hypothetical protein